MESSTCTAFAGNHLIGSGPRREVAKAVKTFADKNPDASILVFDDETSAAVEFDLRGSLQDVLKRLDEASKQTSGPGRPKLGVVSKEISLLPRHWDWLASQPGGASVNLRRLVDEARKQNNPADRLRRSQNAAYKFMSAMAGNFPHFEEASRAFFAGKRDLFETLTAAWPKDIRAHILKVGEAALAAESHQFKS